MLRPETIDAIQEFNTRHDVTLSQQWLQLLEELGEAAEAYNREDWHTFRGELCDLHYVLVSLVLIAGRDHEQRLHETARENLQKDTETDGNKVTKSGVDHA